MAENFLEIVQVMNLQIKDSRHILSRVTKNCLNLHMFSQSREGQSSALGSRGPVHPHAAPLDVASSRGFRAWQHAGIGTRRDHSAAPPPHPLLRPACVTSPAPWARWLALTASIPLHHCRAPWPAGPTLSSTPGGLGPSLALDPVWSWPSPLPSLDLSFFLLRIQFGSPASCLLERPWGG